MRFHDLSRLDSRARPDSAGYLTLNPVGLRDLNVFEQRCMFTRRRNPATSRYIYARYTRRVRDFGSAELSGESHLCELCF